MYRTLTVVNNVVVPFAPRVAGRERYARWSFNSKRYFSKTHCRHQRSTQELSESFLNSGSTLYIEGMYKAWLEDPKSVHKSWDTFFRCSAAGYGPGTAYQTPPTLGESRNQIHISDLILQFASEKKTDNNTVADQRVIDDHLAVQAIIHSYQTLGHHMAKLDPLGLYCADRDNLQPPELMPDHYSFRDTDLDRVFRLPSNTFLGGKEEALTLREILRRLDGIYCQHIGVEYMHIGSVEQRRWIQQRIETPGSMELTKSQKRSVLARLIRATLFEEFLARKWPSMKRYGSEGCEIVVPALKQIIDKSSEMGVESVVMGMAHRGRLSILANVCRKPLEQIFSQFTGVEAYGDESSGDVSTHLGVYIEHRNRVTNRNVRMAMLNNPSHLETVDPVVQGRTRAEQVYSGDCEGRKVMSILLHGDAAFCAQGVVFETFQLADLSDYTTHGTIHIVTNNQIGFTADVRQGRSSTYCTDVAKVVNAPIFHVNGDNPEAVMHVCNIAAEWRNTFHKDVVIDIVSYRRMGHNEVDEPSFTQPRMYNVIKKTPPLMQKYTEKLMNENVVTKQQVQSDVDEYNEICEKAYHRSMNETHHARYEHWNDSPGFDFFDGKDPLKMSPTGVPEDVLEYIGKRFSSPPSVEARFVIHKGIERILKARMQMVDSRQVDWTIAEAMAFGSLLKDGIHVRLSGEDVERGTFSNRHHVLHDQEADGDGPTYRPLSNLYTHQAPYTVCNSCLSEYAVLGFEVGYSMTNPNSLVLWEAQFGDFSNVAQCVIDQYISSSHTKWMKQFGLVMLLPHGLEGVGPEHSSARLERFLQMSADDPKYFPPESDTFAIRQLHDINWIVANCTTPANYFHILRRQVALPFRRPLILMTPKSLLRHPEARSSFDELAENSEFLRIIPENGAAADSPSRVRKLIFCTGKIYYDFKKARKDTAQESEIAISRIEQITPFPFDLVKEECAKYPSAEIIWAQEEHENQGAWFYVQPRFYTALNGSRTIGFVGRPTAAAPATGKKMQFIRETKALLEDAMS